MKKYSEEQILEPLGGWDNLVLMCEAREKREMYQNRLKFKFSEYEVECGMDIDYLFGDIWLLKVRRRGEVLYSSSCITNFDLVRRTFEHYTGFVLEW